MDIAGQIMVDVERNGKRPTLPLLVTQCSEDLYLPRTDGSVGWASGCHGGGRDLDEIKMIEFVQ